MAELFSVAAPIIQLVSLAWTAVKQVTAITEQYKDKTALERRLNSLHLELRRLQEYAPRARATISLEYKCVNNVALAKTVADLAESIASCSGDLYALEKKVSGFFDDHSLEPPFYDFGNVIKPIFHKPKAINSGGTGQVFRVHYHFNYGDSCNDGAIPHTASSHLCYYAVKKLNSTGFHDFSREVSNLQRFTRKPHPHIVPLLGSYRMGGKYHLVFPWADCDLAMYWRLNPEPNNDKSMLEWVVIQMMGLADALSVIHGYHSDKEEPRWHGVHGDIKPANILCFSDNMSRPRLTLADFGSSHIHPLGKAQAPKIDNVKRTPVYRAPEVDIAPKGVTSACDIWSLGCVISETLVWMIKGNTGIQELSSARFDQAQNSPNRDAFFQLKGNPSGELAAQLKPDVQSALLSLRYHPRSTPFSNDILDLLLNGLLRIDMFERFSSRDIHNSLAKMYEKLGRVSNYSEPRGGCLVGNVKMVHSNNQQHLDRTVNASSSTNVTTQSLGGSTSQINSQSHLRFACPFFKCGILISERNRACQGPGFKTGARMIEHVIRCHTPEKYRPKRIGRVCARCDEEFETEELCLAHQRQDFMCILQTPHIPYGMLNRGQAMILGPTKKRKSSTYTDEDQWFDVYRMVSPSYDPSVDKVSPYHESNMTSLDTLNTESSNGLSQIVDHFSKPLAGSELQELATDVDNILKNPDPEVRKALLLAKFDEQPVKRLKKLNEDRLKPVYSYGMQGDGSHEKVKAAENSSEQVPTVARPIARLFVWDNQEDFGNL